MEPVSMKLYELESEEDRKREDDVRPGEPYAIAAEKVSKWVGLRLSGEQLEKLGMAFHVGLGLSWGPVCTVLRRRTGMHPVLCGLLAGAAMCLIVDEGVTPALGFSPPNSAYPMSTHLRGFVAHLVYGVAVALTAEAAYRATGQLNGRA
jgi:uncharacterized membrane protein YagU involved in acid resistance